MHSNFSLSTKKGKETRVEPVIERGKDSLDIRFEIKAKQNELREGTVSRSGARCIFCGTPVSFNYIRSEGRSKRLGSQLMAIVAESKKGRIYLEPTLEHTDVAKNLHPAFIPDAAIVDNPGHTNVFRYGMTTFGDLFTPRQLIALTTLSDLISEVKERILHDAKSAGFSDCCIGVNNGGRGAQAYSEAVVTYLALAIDRLVDYNSTICSWIVSLEAIRNTFARQAIPMVWDFAEANPLSASVGSFNGALNWVADVIQSLPCAKDCSTYQFDSAEVLPDISNIIISTDPPYYDNITYADLSDFFYIWLRRSIFDIYPDIFSTVLTPKSQEIIAAAHRFGGNKEKAKQFFEERLAKSFSLIRGLQNSRFPLTIYYAFRQTEQDNKGRIHSDSVFKSTGWETMLSSLFEARFSITGTWPIRTERSARSVSLGSNALASSIVLVCRPRPEDAPLTTRREFIAALKRELPEAMRQLQKGNIAPVDLAQAAIGPGMAIFSRYSKVLEADGTPMRVRTALQLINQHLDEYLSEQEGEYDPDTRWALSWFEQYGMNEGPFGDAETLSKAKNTSVDGMVEAGILKAGAGKARLLRREEMDPSWDPSTDRRLTVWEATQYLIRTLESEGESEASELQKKLGGLAQSVRDLAYRLYSTCERQGWSQDALAYNSLVKSWPRLQDLAAEKMRKGGQQTFEV